MYDVLTQSSFDNIANWSQTIDQNCGKNVIKILVANKVDVPVD